MQVELGEGLWRHALDPELNRNFASRQVCSVLFADALVCPLFLRL